MKDVLEIGQIVNTRGLRGEVKVNSFSEDPQRFEKVKSIIVEQLGVAETSVEMEASFIDDLGADSLDIVELIMALEEEFDLQIPDNEAEKIMTVGDVVEYIKNNK